VITSGRFFVHFSGENFGENSAENFPQKMLGKREFSAEKVLKNSYFQEIPRNFPRKKMYEKLAAGVFFHALIFHHSLNDFLISPSPTQNRKHFL
jgi:hypothetical protein